MRILLGMTLSSEGKPTHEIALHSERQDLVLDHTNNERYYSAKELVQDLSKDPDLRERGGWNAVFYHPTDTRQLTLWERLLEHTESSEGCPILKTLKLGEHNE